MDKKLAEEITKIYNEIEEIKKELKYRGNHKFYFSFDTLYDEAQLYLKGYQDGKN